MVKINRVGYLTLQRPKRLQKCPERAIITEGTKTCLFTLLNNYFPIPNLAVSCYYRIKINSRTEISS